MRAALPPRRVHRNTWRHSWLSPLRGGATRPCRAQYAWGQGPGQGWDCKVPAQSGDGETPEGRQRSSTVGQGFGWQNQGPGSFLQRPRHLTGGLLRLKSGSRASKASGTPLKGHTGGGEGRLRRGWERRAPATSVCWEPCVQNRTRLWPLPHPRKWASCHTPAQTPGCRAPHPSKQQVMSVWSPARPYPAHALNHLPPPASLNRS